MFPSALASSCSKTMSPRPTPSPGTLRTCPNRTSSSCPIGTWATRAPAGETWASAHRTRPAPPLPSARSTSMATVATVAPMAVATSVANPASTSSQPTTRSSPSPPQPPPSASAGAKMAANTRAGTRGGRAGFWCAEVVFGTDSSPLSAEIHPACKLKPDGSLRVTGAKRPSTGGTRQPSALRGDASLAAGGTTVGCSEGVGGDLRFRPLSRACPRA